MLHRPIETTAFIGSWHGALRVYGWFPRPDPSRDHLDVSWDEAPVDHPGLRLSIAMRYCHSFQAQAGANSEGCHYL